MRCICYLSSERLCIQLCSALFLRLCNTSDARYVVCVVLCIVCCVPTGLLLNTSDSRCVVLCVMCCVASGERGGNGDPKKIPGSGLHRTRARQQHPQPLRAGAVSDARFTQGDAAREAPTLAVFFRSCSQCR